MVYAGDHHGKFPDSKEGPYDALKQLYSEYSSPVELAGVSGNINGVADALRKNVPLDATLTSWIYVPGLHKDDAPETAILWESRGGFYANGKRNFFGGHAVLMISGDITNIPSADWEKFLKNQEQLRKKSRNVN